MTLASCDLFCRVVDNWGDAGVSWRLARQLATERGLRVRLIIDDLRPLQAFATEAFQPHSRSARRHGCSATGEQGLSVHRWADFEDAAEATMPADLVIEMFACDPPARFIDAMSRRAATGRPSVWINLEYLSAESWIDGVHGLPSPHPSRPLTKHFFVPGFSEASGGLIREREIGPCPLALRPVGTEPKLLSFTYPSAPVALIAEAINAMVSLAAPLRRLPARHTVLQPVRQPDFDQLLASHDVLLVRGEDSFVRAQWAARPLLWDIYPTDDQAHLRKLDAWLDRYTDDMDRDLAARYRAISRAFVTRELGVRDAADFASLLPSLRRHAVRWQHALCASSDLVTRLLTFCARIQTAT